MEFADFTRYSFRSRGSSRRWPRSCAIERYLCWSTPASASGSRSSLQVARRCSGDGAVPVPAAAGGERGAPRAGVGKAGAGHVVMVAENPDEEVRDQGRGRRGRRGPRDGPPGRGPPREAPPGSATSTGGCAPRSATSTASRSRPRRARAPRSPSGFPSSRRGCTQNPPQLTVLAIDDERPALDEITWLAPAARRAGRHGARRGLGGLCAAGFSPGAPGRPLVLSDIRMPGLSGLELAQVLRRFTRAAAGRLRDRVRRPRGRGVRGRRGRLPAQAGARSRGWRRRSGGRSETPRGGLRRTATSRSPVESGGVTRFVAPRRREVRRGARRLHAPPHPPGQPRSCASR